MAIMGGGGGWRRGQDLNLRIFVEFQGGGGGGSEVRTSVALISYLTDNPICRYCVTRLADILS